jgi:predicted  nucleic acid-binding Zn-ribbon protein
LATQIELLASLQRLDQAISGKKLEAEQAARQLQALEEAVRQRTAELEQLRGELAEVKKQQNRLEREVAEVEEKMKDRRMRLQRIRNEKELQATQREIDVMKERTAQLEDEELQVLEQGEGLGARVSSAEAHLRDGAQALEAERATLMAREASLAQAIERESEARRELAATLDDGLRRRYELLFARRRGTAVVGVRDGICEGCHMNVPPQLFNEILRGERVFDCPNCHRILFWRPDSPETTE